MSVELLKQELTKLLEEIEEFEYKAEVLQQAIDLLEGNHLSGRAVRDYAPLRKQAVEGLEGASREVPPSNAGPQRLPEPVDSRPLCGGCGGRMEPAFRTLQSGKTVNYLVCSDSGCNNEQLLS